MSNNPQQPPIKPKTDPQGRLFICHRSKYKPQIRKLREKLHHYGIPTWLDEEDLPAGDLKKNINEIIRDPNTSSAIVYITRDIMASEFIKKIEWPALERRADIDEGFFWLPVLGDNMGIIEANKITNRHKIWAKKVLNKPLDKVHTIEFGHLEDAQILLEIVKRVLKERARHLNDLLSPDKPLIIEATTYNPINEGSPRALELDWTHLFKDNKCTLPESFEIIENVLETIKEYFDTFLKGRQLLFCGHIHQPVAVIIGYWFQQTSGWDARFRDSRGDEWSLPSTSREFVGLQYISIDDLVVDSKSKLENNEDFVVFLTKEADYEEILHDFNKSFNESDSKRPPFKGGIAICLGGRNDLNADGKEGGHLAQTIYASIRDARKQKKCLGTVHLFTDCPVGLCFLLGRLFNRFPVRTYAHSNKTSLPYVPQFLLNN